MKTKTTKGGKELDKVIYGYTTDSPELEEENKLLRNWVLVNGHPEVIKGLKHVVNRGEDWLDIIPFCGRSLIVSMIKKTPALRKYLQLGAEFENLFMLLMYRENDGNFHLNTVFHEGNLKEAIKRYMVQLKKELIT